MQIQPTTRSFRLLLATWFAAACFSTAIGQESTQEPAQEAAEEAITADSRAEKIEAMVKRGIEFLRTQQADDGGYGTAADPGATALITTALLQHGVSKKDPVVAKSLAYLKTFVQPDGGIYRPGTYYRNYETCLAILCFTEADGSGDYTAFIDGAMKFVKDLQWGGAGDETSPDDPAFGGAGYGKHGRPDMSNTQYLLDALHQGDSGENREAIERALKFVSRCQNLKSEHNDTKFADRENDGGFYYTAAAGGSSQAGNTANGGLRSYASMTYAGLKSMIYAGLSSDDVRVKAATKWIAKNYSLTENPGMGQAGLFYYYHTFAKALAAVGENELTDADGKPHVWRNELVETLAEKQQDDGSWANEFDRWYETDKKLVTAYALLTLTHCE